MIARPRCPRTRGIGSAAGVDAEQRVQRTAPDHDGREQVGSPDERQGSDRLFPISGAEHEQRERDEKTAETIEAADVAFHVWTRAVRILAVLSAASTIDRPVPVTRFGFVSLPAFVGYGQPPVAALERARDVVVV